MNTIRAAEQEADDRALERAEAQEPARQHGPGETHWSQASGEGLQRPAPKQFSELDESASSQSASNPSMETVGKQAFHDALTSVDTDRGPVLDAVYNGAVTEGHRVGDEEETHGDRDPVKSSSSSTP
jgi:hypothetical protein